MFATCNTVYQFMRYYAHSLTKKHLIRILVQQKCDKFDRHDIILTPGLRLDISAYTILSVELHANVSTYSLKTLCV